MTAKIIGVRITDAKPNKAGNRIIAFFDAEVRGLRMNGCALVRTTRYGLTVWPPKLESPEAARRSLQIIEDSLRHELMDAAREAYRLLGGTEAEWQPRSEVEP